MASLHRFFDPPDGSFFLFGARGTGKSTWIRQTFPQARIVDLLRPDVHRDYAARPELLRQRVASGSGPIVIDEVQKVPALLDEVHGLIEADADLRFILTGSSARKLRRGGVDLLAGRAILRHMHPFMAAEMGDAFSLELALERGLLPLVWSAKQPLQTLRSYAALYLREEVQVEGIVRNVGAFARFLETASFSHGAVLNMTEVARECQLSRKTVESYFDILEDLLLSFRLSVFTRRSRRELVSHPKFYLFDAGVYRTLRPSGPLDRREEAAGAALEGLIAQHLRAWIDYSNLDARLYYWRTRGGLEVDFVVYGENTFHAIEVKHGRSIGGQDVRALSSFGEEYPEATLILIYLGTERLRVGRVECWPASDFLRSVVPGKPLA